MGTTVSLPNETSQGVEGMVERLPYSVVCGIEINNLTEYPLHKPRTTMEWGYLFSPPATIGPQSTGIMLAHKNPGTATGTSGVVSWLIGNTGVRMAIMWSAPYNFNHHSNTLAVGFFLKRDDPKAFKIMYKKSSDSNCKFERGQYYYGCDHIEKTHNRYEVSGNMGSAHKCIARIELRYLETPTDR